VRIYKKVLHLQPLIIRNRVSKKFYSIVRFDLYKKLKFLFGDYGIRFYICTRFERFRVKE